MLPHTSGISESFYETVTGRFYGDLLAEWIFGPLGMTTAMIINEPAVVPNRAAGYETDDGAIINPALKAAAPAPARP